MMQLEQIYVAGSVVITICIWLEAHLLWKNDGKFLQNGIFAVVSLLPSIWLVVSALALYFLDFGRWDISVPIVYVIYSLVGWFYGAKLMGKDDLPDDIKELIIPRKYLVYSQSFAFSFAVLCLCILISYYYV